MLACSLVLASLPGCPGTPAPGALDAQLPGPGPSRDAVPPDSLYVCPAGERMCRDRCVDYRTNPDHCGRCGHGCLGGSCERGRCQPQRLASGLFFPEGLVVEGEWLYVAQVVVPATPPGQEPRPRSQQILRVPTRGGSTTVIHSCTGRCRPLLATDGFLYLAVDGGFVKIPLEGGAEVPVFGASDVTAVATDGRVLVGFTYREGGGPPSLFWRALNGGAARSISTAPCLMRPMAAAVDGDAVFWVGAANPSGVPEGQVCRVSRSTGAVQLLASGSGDLNGIVLAGDRLVVSDFYWGRLLSAPRAGGKLAAVALGRVKPGALRVDGSQLFWLEEEATSIYSLAPGAGVPEVIATGQTGVRDLLVTGTAVYWSMGGIDPTDASYLAPPGPNPPGAIGRWAR